MPTATLQRIAIGPSARLATALCIVHCAAGAAGWCGGLPLWAKGALTAAIGASLAWTLVARALLRAAESVVEVEIAASGGVSFRTRGGRWHACTVLGTTYVSPQLTILNLRPAGSRFARHVVLVPGNVDSRDFRRLRVWLRWEARRELP